MYGSQIYDFSLSSLRTRTTKVAGLNKFYSPKRLPLLLSHSIFSNVYLFIFLQLQRVPPV